MEYNLNINNAFGTGLMVTDTILFTEYIFCGILSPDKNKLTRFISNPTFFNVNMNDIINMNHMIALRTLQQFGFKWHFIHGFGKQVMSVNYWLEHLASNVFDEHTQNAILNNRGLLEYLNNVVVHVNNLNHLDYITHLNNIDSVNEEVLIGG